MLAMMHDRDGPLPVEDDMIWRRCGATSKAMFAATLDVLQQSDLITINELGAWSETMQAEVENRRRVAGSAKENASKGWKKRKQNQRPENAAAYTESESESESESEGDVLKERPPSESRPTSEGSRAARLNGAALYHEQQEITVNGARCVVLDVERTRLTVRNCENGVTGMVERDDDGIPLGGTLEWEDEA